MQIQDLITEHEVIERIVELRANAVDIDSEDDEEDTTDDSGNQMAGTYAIDSLGRVWRLQKHMTTMFAALRLDKPKPEPTTESSRRHRKQ